MPYYIYIYFNKNDDVLYVGKTIDFIKRDQDHRLKDWYNEVDYVKVADVAGPTDQVMYEVYYINKLRPINNNVYNYTDQPSVQLPELDFQILSMDLKKEIREKRRKERKEKLDFLMKRGIVTATFKNIRNENQKIPFYEVFNKKKVYFNYMMNGKDELVVLETIQNNGVFEKDIFKYLLSKAKVKKDGFSDFLIVESSVSEVLNYLDMKLTEDNTTRINQILESLGFLLSIKSNKRIGYRSFFYGCIYYPNSTFEFSQDLYSYRILLDYFKDLPRF